MCWQSLQSTGRLDHPRRCTGTFQKSQNSQENKAKKVKTEEDRGMYQKKFWGGSLTMDEIEDVISHDQTIQDAMSSINQKFMESTGIYDEDLKTKGFPYQKNSKKLFFQNCF